MFTDMDHENDITDGMANMSVMETDPSKSSSKSKKSRRASKCGEQASTKPQDKEEESEIVEESTENQALKDDIDKEDIISDALGEDRLSDTKNGESNIEGPEASEDKKGKQNKEKNRRVKDTLKCNICQKGFQSRNKLFDHIKQTGHAMRVESSSKDATNVVEEEKGKKGKKKRR